MILASASRAIWIRHMTRHLIHLLLPLLMVSAAAVAQDTTPQDVAGDVSDQAEQQNEVLQQEEFILNESDEAEEEEESPDRFIPTEEISQDLGVSFPVDI